MATTKISVWRFTLYMFTVASGLSNVSAIICEKFEEMDKADEKVSVSFRNSSLKTIPQGIPTNVTHLDLSLNAITIIPTEIFSNLTSLLRLDLSGNQISLIQNGGFSGMSSLRGLDLRNNEISNMTSDTFGGDENLTILCLGGNNLNVFDLDVFASAAETLEHLDASYNNISAIQPTNTNFISLKVLNLESNNLGSSEFLWQNGFPALKSLYLGNNSIGSLPGRFFTKFSLLNLDLSENEITQLDGETCFGLGHLEELNLNNNELEQAPKACFTELRSLKTLSMDGNKISVLKLNNFIALGSLEKLDVSACDVLDKIEDGAFNGLSNLTELRLTDNRMLTEIHPEIFANDSNANALKLLALDSNKNLESVAESLLSKLPNLEDLSLRNLALRCDCSVKWIRELIEQRRDSVNVDLTGTTCPNHPSGTSPLFANVRPEEMVCEIAMIVSASVKLLSPVDITLHVTITNTGLPLIVWTLPTGEDIRAGQNATDYNSTDVSAEQISLRTTLLFCTLNVTNMTSEFFGEYVITAYNMAGNLSRNLVVETANSVQDPALVTQTRLTIALVSVLAVLFLVMMVCLINIQYTNQRLEYEHKPLLSSGTSSVASEHRQVNGYSDGSSLNIGSYETGVEGLSTQRTETAASDTEQDNAGSRDSQRSDDSPRSPESPTSLDSPTYTSSPRSLDNSRSSDSSRSQNSHGAHHARSHDNPVFSQDDETLTKL